MQMRFEHRQEAGEYLARKLNDYADVDDLVVLALPRGGVPVAYEVATRLNAPLDVFVVRKLGVPGRSELAMGAIASGGGHYLHEDLIDRLQISDEAVERVEQEERKELERREETYRAGREPLNVHGKTVLLIDDGIATGATMQAAVRSLRKQEPDRIVVGVPTASESTCADFRSEVDEIVCAITPEPFMAVGVWYVNFPQTSDEEVRRCLDKATERDLTPRG